MKGSKKKINQVPSAYTIWLGRVHHQGVGYTPKLVRKGRATFGFNKMARKMIRLGYTPNYARYPSEYSWFD